MSPTQVRFLHVGALAALISLAVASTAVYAQGDDGGAAAGARQMETPHGRSYNRAAVAHAVVGGLAGMIFIPLGAVAPRYFRPFMATWWIPHGIVQGLFSFGLVIAAYALSQQLSGDGDGAHPSTGTALLALMAINVAFGLLLKVLRNTKLQDPARWPSVKGHPIQNLLHIVIGLAILGLGFFQVWSGFDLISENYKQTPQGIITAWKVLVAVFGALWLLGLGLIPLQLRREEARRERALAGSSAPMSESRIKLQTRLS